MMSHKSRDRDTIKNTSRHWVIKLVYLKYRVILTLTTTHNGKKLGTEPYHGFPLPRSVGSGLFFYKWIVTQKKSLRESLINNA